MHFPSLRLRRLRQTSGLRTLVRETVLSPSDFVYPMFITPGSGIRHEIPSMPGIFRQSVDKAIEEISEAKKLGLQSFLLFGIPEAKDPIGSGAYDERGVIQQALREIKKKVDGITLITDVCMCEYTSHGHCGIVEGGAVDNDKTLPLLAAIALSHARAGADIIAPSDMMDGRVKAIRQELDANGFPHVPIMSYSAKYASAFYGPFRDAAESTPQFGDRRGYQMDPPNAREAMREIALDIEEGADIIMVKPALAYLDVIRTARDRFDHPIAAYNVSGEYSMVKAASIAGWIDEGRAVLEILTGIKRAGADIIITYHAKDAARLLSQSQIQ